MSEIYNNVIEILCATAYEAYSLAIHSSNMKAFNWFENPEDGDAVIEITTIPRILRSDNKETKAIFLNQAIGFLEKTTRENIHSDEVWSEIKDEYIDRPTEKVYYINSFDGVQSRWTNATFVRVPQTYKPWDKQLTIKT